MPHDLLYVLKLYGESLAEAIRAAGGTRPASDPMGSLRCSGSSTRWRGLPATPCRRQANRTHDHRPRQPLGTRRQPQTADRSQHSRRPRGCRRVGASDPAVFIAVGEAVDVANELRKLAAAHDKLFAISEPVTTAAGVDMSPGEKLVFRSHAGAAIGACLSSSPPLCPAGLAHTAHRTSRCIAPPLERVTLCPRRADPGVTGAFAAHRDRWHAAARRLRGPTTPRHATI